MATGSGDPKAGASTGAGAEAAQGIQGAQDGGAAPGGTPTDGAKQRGDAARSGSEPLASREQEHRGSYGGEGGSPRTSSDQRERP